jgi:CHAT domain-containing protein/Tfp pilus assembly protein PilF
MASRVFRTNCRKSLGFVLYPLFVLAIATSLWGQATPWYEADGFRSTAGNPEYSKPNTFRPSIPPVNGNLPGPSVRPTTQDTERFINSEPNLRSLDPALKQALIYNSGNTWLNSPTLPNGTANPLHQNGQLTPNWYVPSTWSSPAMNWRGVQPNGFLPAVFKATYSPSSLGGIYNPSSGYSLQTHNTSNLPTYRPTPQTPSPVVNRSPQAPSQGPIRSQIQAPAMDRSVGARSSDTRKAIEDGERTLSVHEAAGDKVAQAIDRAELAQLYVDDGKLAPAFEQLHVAQAMAKSIDDPRSQADILRRSAAAYMAAGEFDQSIDVYRKAMQSLRSVGDDRGQAEVYAGVGWAFQSLGKTPDALRCYDAAFSMFERVGDKDGQVRIRIGVGSFYQSIGEFTKALNQYTKALPDASKDQQATIQSNIGEMYLSRDEPIEAIHHYEAALPLVQSGDNPALEGTILAGMGRGYMALDSYRAAPETRIFFERARGKMKDAGNRAGEAGVIASIGELNYWLAISSPTVKPKVRFSEALESYNLALPMMRDVGDPIGEIGVLTNMGLVFDAWGKYPEALGYYLQALQKMDELQTSARIDEFRIDMASQSAGLYERTILLEVKLNRTEEAFDLSERARARTFLDQLGNRRTNARLPADFVQREARLRQENISLQRRLGQELSKPGPEVEPEKITSLNLQLSTVRAEYSELISKLKVENSEYASFLSIAPLNLQEVQAQLEPDVTAISYFTTPMATLAFVLTRDRFHVSKLPVTEAELAWAVATFLDFSGESGVPPSLRLLHKWLIAPIKSQLKTSKLAVVPNGILHDVPFAALSSGGSNYLSDGYAVFSLPSLSVLPYLRARNKTNANQVMVFANNQEEGLSYLGHAYDEARDVASIWGTQPILGDAATASTFQKSAGDYDIVHLIAHFDHDELNPQFSRVILGHDANDEGALDVDQVLGLDLRKTNLVVLSGCQSQAGKWSRGDDIVGLSRAFIYAGSPSVIASLWSVDDEATRALMVFFYTHLRQGLSKAEALRAAQIEMRKKYPHPYYWAGFVLTGDPGPTGIPNLVARSTH